MNRLTSSRHKVVDKLKLEDNFLNLGKCSLRNIILTSNFLLLVFLHISSNSDSASSTHSVLKGKFRKGYTLI